CIQQRAGRSKLGLHLSEHLLYRGKLSDRSGNAVRSISLSEAYGIIPCSECNPHITSWNMQQPTTAIIYPFIVSGVKSISIGNEHLIHYDVMAAGSPHPDGVPSFYNRDTIILSHKKFIRYAFFTDRCRNYESIKN